VVDTGSTDDSVDIARSFGARVFHEPWTNDFSAARNAALDHASGKWILYIDADERLRVTSRDEVVALLDQAEEVAFRVLLRPFVGATPCREFRLWRNDPRIRFEGIIHEKVVPSIRAVGQADGRAIGLCELGLDHLGYEGVQVQKHERNLPLLRAQLAAEPGNVFNWRHLATVLDALGDTCGADEALTHALDLVRQRTTIDGAPGGQFVYADLTRRHRERGRRDDARRVLDEGRAAYPHDPLLVWLDVVMALDDGASTAAIELLDRLATTDLASLDDTLSYDERLFGVFPHEARGLALFRLGQFAASADSYRAAEMCEPEKVEHRTKRLLAEHLAAGSSPA
jgi:tetratricopeptide (TPR) repeat protein